MMEMIEVAHIQSEPPTVPLCCSMKSEEEKITFDGLSIMVRLGHLFSDRRTMLHPLPPTHRIGG